MSKTAVARPGMSALNGFAKISAIAAFSLSTAAVLVTVPTPVVAQSFVFTNVEIEGAQRIEPGTILSYAGIARGQPVSASQLNDAFQNIQNSGLFEEVEIVPQGNTLLIRVVEYPTINRIAIEGNRRIDDEDLQPLLQSQSRRVYSPSTAEADANLIAEAYVAQGRIAARVQPRLIRRSDNRVDLVFEVFEGGVAEVERIAFVGNQQFSDRRLRRVLETKQAGLLRAIITRDTFIADRIEFDRQLLEDFYSSRGYVDFRITGTNAELAAERDGYFVTFNVEEGQQFRFGEITVTSDLAEVDIDAFQRAVAVRPGKVYAPQLVDRDIERLERRAVEEGLDFVRVEPRVTRNDRDLSLDIEYVLTRGPRIFVERIDIEGNTTTLDRVVRRQFETVEGDPFNPREIRNAAERIRALGFFADAEVQAREGSTPQQVIVDVDVEEQPTGSISIGGSYSTSSGFGLNLSFAERNFIGRGQQLSLGLTSSSDSNRYSFSFVEPALLGRDLAFGIGLSYSNTERQNADYNTETGTFSPSLTFPISDNGRLQLRYTLEYTDLTLPDESDVGGIVTSEAEAGALYQSSIGYRFSYDTRRTGLDPNAGVLLEFGQDFGGVGGDTTFVKTDVRAVAQRLAFSEEVTLRAIFEGGALNYTGDQGSRVTDRFFLGSSRMRGFEPGGIGPREKGAGFDDALGGNYYAVARFEAEFPLGLPEEYGIAGGVFYDVGSLWGLDDTDAATGEVLYEDGAVRQVIGLSLFWTTPLGPLRFNFSEALQKEDEDREQNFELTISTDF
ncbi:Outer membrane protein assembly factor BamA precursor [Roseivivax sp. THAF40]|uniref:outer membrane protein assembly factor BamA n=1 Tax=unclassified Roseivivax TaxID=2639302 RepID=UPI0012A7C36B|nr:MULTISPECIES: outer membrane protein assembly factor BamA [unclassified Roseivivax]QFS83304.1 Outer membrane protein assembly factor BamA precursor [Roseivivax sp. THAF197b]QFT47048.1 Outer membrane protein assembly factor BamA precursor [Roseivivax sp. THAF40]